jgi:hypothetical protein
MNLFFFLLILFVFDLSFNQDNLGNFIGRKNRTEKSQFELENHSFYQKNQFEIFISKYSEINDAKIRLLIAGIEPNPGPPTILTKCGKCNLKYDSEKIGHCNNCCLFYNPKFQHCCKCKKNRYPNLSTLHCVKCCKDYDSGYFHCCCGYSEKISVTQSNPNLKHCCKCKQIHDTYSVKHCVSCCFEQSVNCNLEHCCSCAVKFDPNEKKHCDKCHIIYNNDENHCCRCDKIWNNKTHIHKCCCNKEFDLSQEHCDTCCFTQDIFDTRVHCCNHNISWNCKTQSHCCKCNVIHDNTKKHCCKCNDEYDDTKVHCDTCCFTQDISDIRVHCCRHKISWNCKTQSHCCRCDVIFDNTKEHCNICCINFPLRHKHCCRCNNIWQHEDEKTCICNELEKTFFDLAIDNLRKKNIINRFLLSQCISRCKSSIFFTKGIRQCGFSSMNDFLSKPENFTFCFHGTPEISRAFDICCDSWNLKFRGRCGQAYGVGEYLTSNIETAKQYAKNSGAILLTIIPNSAIGSKIKKIIHNTGEEWFIVNNETDVHYVFPVGILEHYVKLPESFECQNETKKNMFAKLCEKACESDFALYYYGDDGKSKYDDCILREIIAQIKAENFVFDITIGYNRYTLDFKRMKQTNKSSGYERDIYVS